MDTLPMPVAPPSPTQSSVPAPVETSEAVPTMETSGPVPTVETSAVPTVETSGPATSLEGTAKAIESEVAEVSDKKQEAPKLNIVTRA